MSIPTLNGRRTRALLDGGGGCLLMAAAMFLAGSGGTIPRLPGDWPTPRQNRHLTALQPLPGRMRAAPRIAARLSLGPKQGQLHPFASRPGGPVDHVIAIADGRLRCYRLAGTLLLETPPPGLDFEQLV